MILKIQGTITERLTTQMTYTLRYPWTPNNMDDPHSGQERLTDH